MAIRLKDPVKTSVLLSFPNARLTSVTTRRDADESRIEFTVEGVEIAALDSDEKISVRTFLKHLGEIRRRLWDAKDAEDERLERQERRRR